MAKARAIVKRRKAVRNIRKITKTMQLIATAKFPASLRTLCLPWKTPAIQCLPSR